MRSLAAPLCALLCCFACAGDPPPPADVAPAAVVAADSEVLRLAGSGAMIPLARALAGAWQRRGDPPRMVVEESLGSAGGIAAAHDGAIDLGMVSRPLSAKELELGLTRVPVAIDAVVIAAHALVPVRGLTSAQLRELYRGAARTFPDGSPATVLLRDRGESANRVLEAAVMFAVRGLVALREAPWLMLTACPLRRALPRRAW